MVKVGHHCMIMGDVSNHPPTRYPLAYLASGVGNASNDFPLYGNTLIGRRPMVDSISKFAPQLTFEGNKQSLLLPVAQLSKEHARIEVEHGSWRITDLGTSTGTVVNGDRVRRKPRQLQDGDSVFIGPVHFIFRLEPVVRPFHNAALLAGSPGKPRLSGVENDLRSMETALMSRKYFAGNISSLYDTACRKEQILQCMLEMAPLLSDDSTFIFYFSGHGSMAGVHLNDGVLGPSELFLHLESLKGKKLILLDCCYSSTFAGEMQPGMLLLRGESPDNVMYEGKVTVLAPWASANRQGFLTRAFVKLLEENRGQIDLKDAAAQLQGYRRLAEKDVRIIAEGGSIPMASMVAPIPDRR